MDTQTLVRETLEKRIAGEIVLSGEPGKVIQKWRNIFKISQRRLADEMKIMPSVISDYENGRRKSPGIRVVRKIVDSLINVDVKNGGRIIQDFSVSPHKNVLSEAVLNIKEFDAPVDTKDFCKIIEAAVVAREDLINRKIYGYTVIDSVKAILEFSPLDMVKLYGLTSERALIFVGAHRGRSSMVALKVTNLRPGLVILQGSEGVDDLAKRIAELEGVPLGITKIRDVNELMRVLKKTYS